MKKSFQLFILIFISAFSLFTEEKKTDTELRENNFIYLDKSKKPVLGKLLFDKNKQRKSLTFFSEDTDPKKLLKSDLDGISKMEYSLNEMSVFFEAKEYNSEGKLTFTHQLKYDDKFGWEYHSFDKNKEDTPDFFTEAEKKNIFYQKQKFDFDGNPIHSEYLDKNGEAILFSGIHSIYRNWDKAGNLILEEFRNKQGELENNRYGYAKVIATFNKQGLPTEKSYYDKSGMLTGNNNNNGVAKEFYSYNQKGQVLEMILLDKDHALKNNQDFIAKYSFDYDSNGNMSRVEYRNENAKLQANPDYIAREIFTFDENNHLISQKNYLQNGLPAEKEGVFETKYSYDTYGRILTKEFVRADGMPAAKNEGIAKYEITYDKTCSQVRGVLQKGIQEKKKQLSFFNREQYFKNFPDPILNPKERCVDSITTFDQESKAIANRQGVFRTEYHYTSKKQEYLYTKFYDIENRLLRSSIKYGWVKKHDNKMNFYGDLEGNPILREYYDNYMLTTNPSWKYARIVNKYDEKGNEILEAYYDENNKPVSDGNYARKVCKYDKQGNEILREYYDANNRLVNTWVGYAKAVFKYDKNGNTISKEYYKNSGEADKITYKRVVYQYDTEGNHVSTEYYDNKNKLILNKSKGYARAVYQFDKKGKQILEEYYDQNNKMIFLKDEGYARMVKQFDEKGKQILEAYYGSDNKLMNREGIIYGYAKKLNKYDNKGNKILEEYYDKDNKLIFVKNAGYAKKINQYDEKGNQTLEENYDENNKLSFRRVSKYNHMGKLILQENYGANNKFLGRNVFQYDKMGNQILAEYYDANNELVNPAGYGYARRISKYDKKGNEILREYYDKNKKLTRTPYSGTITIHRYDHSCQDSLESIYYSPINNLEKEIKAKKETKTTLKNDVQKEKQGRTISKLERKLRALKEQKETESKNCILLSEAYDKNGNLMERIERSAYSQLKTIEKTIKFATKTENQKSQHLLKNAEYYLYFPNPKGSQGKNFIKLSLDKLYRPIKIEFLPTSNMQEQMESKFKKV
ncbi:MAG: hypothetical protein KDK45_08815, partial [Leptospiraceae bacterium]|nr:hypothetical protein [Leptospiraceae bacterium]